MICRHLTAVIDWTCLALVACAAQLSAAEPRFHLDCAITNEQGRALEGVAVRLCGIEHQLPDGTWDRNRRPHCLMPRVEVEGSRFTLEMQADGRLARANFWLEKEDYAPTFVAGLLPGPDVRTIVLRRGMRVAGKVERLVDGERVPVDRAALELRCLAGDLEYQRRYFRDPLSTTMRDGGDLGYRQTVFTDTTGQYVLQLVPPPPGKQWFLVCLDEAVTLDAPADQPVNGPDFVVTVQARPAIKSGAAAP